MFLYRSPPQYNFSSVLVLPPVCVDISHLTSLMMAVSGPQTGITSFVRWVLTTGQLREGFKDSS